MFPDHACLDHACNTHVTCMVSETCMQHACTVGVNINLTFLFFTTERRTQFHEPFQFSFVYTERLAIALNDYIISMGGRYLESVPDGCVQCLQEAEGALLVEEGAESPNNSCSSQ